MTEGKLTLRLAVEDSKISPGIYPWEGSGIELFFTAEGGYNTKQLFIVPQPGARKAKFLDLSSQPIKGALCSIKPHGSGYEALLEVPLLMVGIPSGAKKFYFDLTVHLSELGNAHTGGATSLSGLIGLQPAFDHYWQVIAG